MQKAPGVLDEIEFVVIVVKASAKVATRLDFTADVFRPVEASDITELARRLGAVDNRSTRAVKPSWVVKLCGNRPVMATDPEDLLAVILFRTKAGFGGEDVPPQDWCRVTHTYSISNTRLMTAEDCTETMQGDSENHRHRLMTGVRATYGGRRLEFMSFCFDGVIRKTSCEIAGTSHLTSTGNDLIRILARVCNQEQAQPQQAKPLTFAQLYNNRSVTPRCAGCRKVEIECDKRFQYCSRCRQVQYCSAQCQKDHWNRETGGHRSECKNPRKNKSGV